MPSSYTTSLRLTLPATGELSGQWGNTVNTGITELLDAAVAGTASISTWGGAGVAYTLSNNSGTADEARKMFIVATGSPGEAKNVICPAVSKFYVFRNDTTGGYALTLKTSGGTGIAVPAGQYKFLYCDGTNVVEMFNSAGALTLSGALSVGGTATFAANPTLSAGTANQVQYLNGSKVLTGSANLTFDGTTLTGAGFSGPLNGSVGATTPSTGAFTTLSASSTVSGTGFTNLFASPPAIGSTAANTGAFTTLSASSSVTLSGGTANGVLYLNGSKVATSGSALTFDGTTLNFGSTAQRITGDMSNATLANRLNFQNSVVNTSTSVGIIPNGTGASSRLNLFNSSAPDNSSYLQAGIDASAAYILSSSIGTGTNLPLSFITGGSTRYSIQANGESVWFIGSEQMRLTSTGLGIGTSSPNAKLEVNGNAILGAEVYRSVDTSYLRMAGGNPAATGANVIVFGSTHATAPGRVSINAVGTGHTEFSTGGAERMRLDSVGNLGIGTSSPQSGGVTVFTGTAGGATTPGVMTLGPNSTTVASGEVIGRIQFYSNDASGSSTGVVGKIDCVATSNFVGDCETALTFHTNDGVAGTAAERMRLDSSGNLGLGVTPSAWNASFKSLQVSNSCLYNNGAADTFLGANFYNDTGGTNRYTTSAHAAAYGQVDGAHQWYTAPSGTAGNAISFTQAMTLDASGRLCIGATSGTEALNIQRGAGASGYIEVAGNNNGIGTASVLYGQDSSSNGYYWNRANAPILLGTNNTERARITSGGYFKASNGGTYVGSTSPYHELRKTENNADWAVFISHAGATAANQFGTRVDLAGDPNGLSNEFLYCSGGATLRASIRSNGGLANFSGNNVNLSDRREKTNFAPAKSYLDTICAIPVQTFEYIDQSPDDPGLTLGVVAQDVQAVAPELVMESNWGTEDNPKMRLSIYQTDLQYALMKCIQELKTQNDELRARVQALEAQP